MFSIFHQVEAKKKIESENRELERFAALYKHDMKEVRICIGIKIRRFILREVEFLANGVSGVCFVKPSSGACYLKHKSGVWCLL